MSEICVLASLTAKEGKREELLECFKHLIEETRKEPGCIYYDLCESNPGCFTFVESYKSVEDLETHMKLDHFTKAYPIVVELVVDGKVDIKRLTKVI